MSSIDVEAVDSVDDKSKESKEPEERTENGSGDIEVRATDTTELPEGVDAPEYVLYGGKGGVGKTTMAAATALSSAAGGVPTLVVSTDPAHSLSDTLETQIPPRPTQVREDMPLYAAEIDPDAAMDEGLFGQGAATERGGPTGEDAGANPFGGTGDAGGFGETGDTSGMDGMNGMGGMGELFGEDGPMGPMLGGTMPGSDEAAAMSQLLEYLDDPRFDRVVIDTAPTGHTLRLLQLPEMLDSMVGRMMKLRQQFGGMMGRVKGMFGGTGDDDIGGVGDLDELQERIERLRTVLRDPTKTDFRVVMIPEEMSVVESERLVSRLGEFGIPVQTLVVNRVMESLGDVADVSSERFVSPDLDDCEFCQRRWKVQQNALRQSMELFRGRDVKRVPLLADEVQGEDALRVVAACLN